MIEAQGLCKNFGSVEAVKDVSFTFLGPEIFGILGPNGAGKTTILRMLTGFYAPSAGTVSINGLSVEDQCREAKELIGYLPENNPLYGDISPREYLGFIAEVHLIPKSKKKNAIESALVSCGLEDFQHKRIDTLSKGYRQRTGLAAALIHDPPVLILDEPASGLDPNQIIGLRSLIRELGKRKTLLLSTHVLQEAEALCSRLLILNEGRIQAQGSLNEIAESLGMNQAKLSLEGIFVKLTNAEKNHEAC
ncbi:MAG: ATP-binding cassette domain-containing protein [Treponema sp.]|jgi:ABC-2 type transport system ATP-binding protein|nr:ATP-binding cassette domain-containing protein [Treponema sp.]